MKKDKQFVVDMIREAMVKEELAIPLYVSHIEQTFFWSGLSKEKQDIIIKNLEILEKDSEWHAQVLRKMYEDYSKLI